MILNSVRVSLLLMVLVHVAPEVFLVYILGVPSILHLLNWLHVGTSLELVVKVSSLRLFISLFFIFSITILNILLTTSGTSLLKLVLCVFKLVLNLELKLLLEFGS